MSADEEEDEDGNLAGFVVDSQAVETTPCTARTPSSEEGSARCALPTSPRSQLITERARLVGGCLHGRALE